MIRRTAKRATPARSRRPRLHADQQERAQGRDGRDDRQDHHRQHGPPLVLELGGPRRAPSSIKRSPSTPTSTLPATPKSLILDGAIKPVKGTPFDFTTPKPIGKDFKAAGGKPVGFDANWIVNGDPHKMREG